MTAIVDLCPAVQAAARLTDHGCDLTVNVGHIEGGTVLNRVPHQAAASLEMRAYDPALLQQTGDAIRALGSPASPGKSAIEIECLGTSPAWPEDERNRSLAQHWLSAASDLGLTAKLTKRGGLSDANYLWRIGPTLDGLGPSGANAHCSERSPDGSKLPEYVEVNSFVPKAAMNVLAIQRCLTALR